ncbi:HTH domain-containing protein [Helicobacter pylori]|uniref:HTH domain-containing protein n=1 Tax=Helicobacter pylori TaxID=210 RepID=UPI0024B8A24F|nr:HTH domain-containing protein [Helicobacter pylori]
MTYKELGKKVLEQAERPLSVKEIWEIACEMGLDKERNGGKILPHSLGSVLGQDKKQFYVINRKEEPFRYWLKSREREFPPQKTPDAKEEDDDGQSECSDTAEKQKISPYEEKEKDLHKLLVKFLYENPDFNLQCKTICHEPCKKGKGGKNKWNYPDIVGVYFPYNKYSPYDKYQKETLEFLHHTGQKRHKLFSFELKTRINFSNLKESYFQAVCNSTWANEGYLVVFEEIEDKVLSELRRLNQSFGIGVIKLESEISNSKILLPAKEREIDIPTLNMLVEQSPKDFEPFIKDINKQIKAGFDTHVKVAGLDPVLDNEAMQKYIEKKGIKAGKNGSALSFLSHF